MPRFSSYFCIWPLNIASFLLICWSVKAFASVDNFDSLPEHSKLARVPVVCGFFMMRATLRKLTLKPLGFKTLNIPAGWRPSFWTSSIWVLKYIDTLGMVNCDSLKAELTKTHNFSQTMPRSHRAWVHYGRNVSSTMSCISCSKKTGWQTNHLSLQALRLTNKVISAFSGNK